MSAVEAWSVIADWVMAAAAVVAAGAALYGLNTWKNQNIWVADSDLARRVLIEVYRYRDSLYSVRHPAMSNSEMHLADDEAVGLSEDHRRRQGVVTAYVRRWERHGERKNELDALLIETDAVWGPDLSGLVSKLEALDHELFVYIKLFLDANYRGDTELAQSYRGILKTKRDIIYDRLDEEDAFRQDFVKALGPVEQYLRGKLGRTT